MSAGKLKVKKFTRKEITEQNKPSSSRRKGKARQGKKGEENTRLCRLIGQAGTRSSKIGRRNAPRKLKSKACAPLPVAGVTAADTVSH